MLVLAAVLASSAPAAAADTKVPKGVEQLWSEFPLREKAPSSTVPAPSGRRPIHKKTTRPERAASPQAAGGSYSDSARRLTLVLAAVAATGVFLLLLLLDRTRLVAVLIPRPPSR